MSLTGFVKSIKFFLLSFIKLHFAIVITAQSSLFPFAGSFFPILR
ncbi:hypothetical protein HMPREF1548_01010 [Clostridium sp. KLE 1755]|nr:hypothetical protein HMPREF1548_01010 [Clostridium sp. KLE 1755]